MSMSLEEFLHKVRAVVGAYNMTVAGEDAVNQLVVSVNDGLFDLVDATDVYVAMTVDGPTLVVSSAPPVVQATEPDTPEEKE